MLTAPSSKPPERPGPHLESELSFLRSENFVKRILMTLTGVFVCSISVGMFNLSAFGVDPFQCFAQGSHRPFSGHMSYGTYYLIISLIMLAGIFVWDKRYIGIATVINMFFTGYLVDYSYSVLVAWLPDATLLQRALLLLVALVIMCFGSALYYTANLGVSVYDAISLILAKRRINLRGYIVPFKWIRVINDLICVALGALFGKLPGVGTLITAFFMGPLISFFNTRFAEPFLYGKGGRAPEQRAQG